MKTAVFVLLAAAAVVLFLAPAAEAQDATALTLQVIMRTTTGLFGQSGQLCLSVGSVRDSSGYPTLLTSALVHFCCSLTTT
jgi:hypothetical protein